MTDNAQLSPGTPNRIEDHAPKAPGVIPKHMQSLVIMGVALAMILIMWLTGGTRKATLPKVVPLPPPTVSPTDASKVQDFKQAIQSEQQAVRRAVPTPDAYEVGQFNVPGAYGATAQPGSPLPPISSQQVPQGAPPVDGYLPGQVAHAGSAPPEDPVKAEKKKRQYLSLFASNVALTYRQGEEARRLMGATGTASAAPTASSAPQDPAADYLRQLQALGVPSTAPPPAGAQASPAPDRTDPGQTPKTPAKAVSPDAIETGVFNKADGKTYVLFEGTVIESVLVNRLDGTFAGPVNCLVTQDVYSHDRQHVLIPAGSKVLGEASRVNTLAQQRLAVAFHRLIMPDGYSVSLDQFKGLDQLGATALRDKVNNHYLKIFGASLAVGVLGGIAEAGTGDVFNQSALDRARAGFGENSALAGEQILEKFLNVLPTITIREGTRVKVYLSNDLLLPGYAQHRMDPGL